jgi:predicted alpha/beta superfamily hydrolase
VIIAFDGEYSFGQTVAAARYLAAAGQIPEALIIAVENISEDPRDRVRDLTPPGLSVSGSGQNEGGGRFLDFLEKELLPALARQFRAGAPNILIGHSSGAILVTYAAATRAKVFPFVVAIDAPTHHQQGWLSARVIEAAKKPASPFLRYASLEARFGWADKAWNALQSAVPEGWKLYRQKLEHETHNSMAFLATYLGLREVFADFSMLAAPDSPTSAALEHYRKYNAASGLALIPPRPLLSRVIEDFLIEGNARRAQEALDLLIAGYGDTPRASAIRAQIAEAAKLPQLDITVEDLLAAPKPSPQQMAEFLGEWNGEEQAGEAPAHALRLRLEVKDGVVQGAWINWPAPDVELVMPLQYLKIVEGGLHFGFLNGMRPRGMLVYEAALRNGRLEGEMHMRGVRFTPPRGMGKMKFHFWLEKKTGAAP